MQCKSQQQAPPLLLYVLINIGTARSNPSLQESPNEFNLELTIEEFREKIGPHLGPGTTLTDMDQLFMKIDADCGGTVDW